MREEYKRWTIVVFAIFCALVASASVSEAEVLVAEKSPDLSEVSKEPTPEPEIETEVEGVIEFAAPLISTLDGIQAARWSPNVTVSLSTGVFRYESDGIPDHELPDPFEVLERSGRGLAEVPEFRLVDVRASLVESPIDEAITLHPVLAAEPSPAPEGRIGVLINGAQLHNEPNLVTTNGLGQERVRDLGFVDSCNGQPIDDGDEVTGSIYHYHAVPRCTTDAIDVEAQHSSILGVLIDGFPVYGSKDEGGAPVRRRDLDECFGHFGPTPEFPDGIYHYHLVEQIRAVPIPCLSGELNTLTNSVDSDDEVLVNQRDDDSVVADVRDEVEQLGEQ